MRHYEIMIILDPNLEERTVQPSLDQFLKVVTGGGGKVEKVDIWGKRRLAYQIQKKPEGYYAVVDVTSEAKEDEPACHVAMSIEVFDQNDGRTQIYQGAFTSLANRFRLGAKIQNCCTICCRALGDVCTDERSSCVDFGQTPTCPKCT